MARPSTLFRIKLEISDVDRGVYESLDVRVAQHPSEDESRVVARVLAYALLYEEGLEFGRGLSEAEDASLWVHDLTGRLLHWIDVGTPSAERIHLASKKAERVSIVCHKDEEALRREMSKRAVFDADKVDVFYLDPSLIRDLSGALQRNSTWIVVHTDGQLSISIEEQNFSGSVLRTGLPAYFDDTK